MSNKARTLVGGSSLEKSTTLSPNDVFDLVLEYLSTKGFNETEKVLKKEAMRSPKESGNVAHSNSASRLEDLLEKSYVTELASGVSYNSKVTRTHLDAELPPLDTESIEFEALKIENGLVDAEVKYSIDTQIIAYNPCENDPYGASSMPIYQTATFKQPSATEFGEYDYTRSGNPTRDALQNQIAQLEGGGPGARAFCFTTGMAALAAVTRLLAAGDEVIVNDDSYGGTYRLMSKVCSRQGIKVKYVNMTGKAGPACLEAEISSATRYLTHSLTHSLTYSLTYSLTHAEL
jgi:cystathionine beta-lyase